MIHEHIVAVLGQVEVRNTLYLIAEEVFGDKVRHTAPTLSSRVDLDLVAPDPTLTLINANKLIVERVLEGGVDSDWAVAQIIDVDRGHQVARDLWEDLESREALVVEVDLARVGREVDELVDDKGHEKVAGLFECVEQRLLL